MKCPAYEITDFGIFDSSVKFPRVRKTDPRNVEEYEIELCTADHKGVLFINGEKHPAACGTLICAKPGQVRQSVLPFKCLYLHLKTEDRDLLSLLDALPDALVLQDISEPVRIFHEILGLEAMPSPEAVYRMQSLAARLFVFLSPLGRSWREKGVSSAYIHQKALLEVERTIRENPSEPLDLKTLAAKVNLSPVYFHRIFTDYFGKTPSRYVLECRIAAAKLKLVTEDGSMAEIAAACGFSSQAYFNFKFKETVGQTPLQYRKSMLSRARV
ncbi:MAG: helix-turn-helix transcriptional regulator [Clostridia bacterium]|nr:helix-turn-helix transcriptional regulator [Clostridia bacterium]